MNEFKRRAVRAAFVAIAATGVMLVGCKQNRGTGASTTTGAKVAPETVIRFAHDQVVENVDPYFNSLRLGFMLGHHVWDTLLYREPVTNEIKGNLATSWKWIDDKTLELELRKDVVFHNGEEFDADDVVYTLSFAIKPESKIVVPQHVSFIERAEKLDKFKVRIVTREPFPPALEYLAGPIFIHPNEYYAKVGPKGMNEKPVGTGPFKIVAHDFGKAIRFARNERYFQGGPKKRPAVDRLELRFIPERQTQIAELISGGLDLLMAVPRDQADQLEKRADFQVVTGGSMRVQFLQMDAAQGGASGPLRDVRVRQAIMHAIDRDTYVKRIVGGGGAVAPVLCYQSQFGCPERAGPDYPYDVARAKALLAEAGFPHGFDVDFFAYRDRTEAEALAGYLAAVGIRANLRILQYAAVRDNVRARKSPLTLQSWGSASINDVSAIIPVFFKHTSDDVARDDEVRDLLARGDGTLDKPVRQEAYAKALGLIQSRAYALPLASLPVRHAAKKGLSFTADPDELLRFWEMRWN